MKDRGSSDASAFSNVIEVTIRLLVIGIFLVACYRILKPFIGLIVWGGVLAVVLDPIVRRIASAIGGRRKIAITILVIVGFALILIPVIKIAESGVESAAKLMDRVESGTLEVPPPPARVAEWPVIGKRVYAGWHTASVNLQTFVTQYEAQVQSAITAALSASAKAGASVLELALALLVAALFLANFDAAAASLERLADRLVGRKGGGAGLVTLSAATVRSVTLGVLGVAVIQSILAGLGMLWAGVPAAGLWALAVLFLAIVQLPPVIVLLPIALWVFGSADSQLVGVGFLIYSVLVSVSDMVLKPMLMGRGVDVPMPVILLGAIGGMIAKGIIGLFVGAVTLALGYKLFEAWIEMADQGDASEPLEPAATSSGTE